MASFVPRTIGNATVGSVRIGEPLVLLNHTLSAAARLGVLGHFWITASLSDAELLNSSLSLLVEYFLDGDVAPSIAYNPAMAAGNAYPAAVLGGAVVRTQQDVGDRGMYSAGRHMGNSAEHSGWWNAFKIPFQRTAFVRLRIERTPTSPRAVTAADGTSVYVIVRGHEDMEGRGITLPSGVTLPLAARLALQRIDGEEFPALGFVPIATLPSGRAGLVGHLTIAVETSPPWNPLNLTASPAKPRNNWIEGCWHLYTTAGQRAASARGPYHPGVVMGTGCMRAAARTLDG